MMFTIFCMSSIRISPSRSRLVAVTASLIGGVSIAAWGLAVALSSTARLIAAPGRTGADELITALSAAAALLLMLWLTLGMLSSAVGTLPGPGGVLARRVRDRIAPGAVRRWSALMLGVAVASGVAPGGAVATPTTISQALDEVDHTRRAPDPSWLPVQAVTPAPEWIPVPVRSTPPVSLTTPRELAQDTQDVVVRRGDTLWDLAAAHLSPEATDAEIAAEWQRWYAANRAVIGDDPDLILPGQILVIPATHPVPAGGSR